VLVLNAGLPGMASLHANSARQALVKLCTLTLLAGDNIGSPSIVPPVLRVQTRPSVVGMPAVASPIGYA